MNLGNPVGNQSMSVFQVVGNNLPPPTPTRQHDEQKFVQPKPVYILARQLEEGNYDEWMSHADEPTNADKKMCMLEECMRAFLNQGAMGLDMSDLGLVPGVKVPPKFKVPDFVK